MVKITALNCEIFVRCLGYRLPATAIDTLRPTNTYREFAARVDYCLPDDYLTGSNNNVEYIIERGYMFCLEHGRFRPYEVRWKYGNIRNMEPYFTTVFGQHIDNRAFMELYIKDLHDIFVPSNYIPILADMGQTHSANEPSFDDLADDPLSE